MSEVSYKLATSEKFGYALGDAAANLVWRGALAFLMVFYNDVFGISPESAAGLVLIVRLSDGVTDTIMGMIADRTTYHPLGQVSPVDTMVCAGAGAVHGVDLFHAQPQSGVETRLCLCHVHRFDIGLYGQQRALLRTHGCYDRQPRRTNQPVRLAFCWCLWWRPAGDDGDALAG